MTEGLDRQWRRWVFVFMTVLTGGCVAFAVFVVLVDPYDSGRLLSVLPRGISDEAPRTANISRGRDPDFNAVIVGNSTAQLLQPENLSASTGFRFVQMTVPGTGPREQMSLLTYFIKHHRQADAVVIGADETWCGSDPALPLANPFPFSLYGGFASFAASHLNMRSLARSVRRIQVAAGVLPATSPAGYWDYELGRAWSFRPAPPAAFFSDMSPRRGNNPDFPAVALLASTMAELPAKTKLIVHVPPQFRGAFPDDAAELDRMRACKYAIMQRVSARPHSAFLDFRLDTPDNRAAENFMDNGHYRSGLARKIEREISITLQTMPRAK